MAALPEFTSVGIGFPFPIYEDKSGLHLAVHEHKQTSPPAASALLRLRLKWASPSWPLLGVWFHLVRWWTALGPAALRVRLVRAASDGVSVAQGVKFLRLSSISPEAAMKVHVARGQRLELGRTKQTGWISKESKIDQSLSFPVWITAIKLWLPTQALCSWTCCDGCSVGVVGDKVRLRPPMTVLAGGAAGASSRCFPV